MLINILLLVPNCILSTRAIPIYLLLSLNMLIIILLISASLTILTYIFSLALDSNHALYYKVLTILINIIVILATENFLLNLVKSRGY
jgi:hypothetical protein